MEVNRDKLHCDSFYSMATCIKIQFFQRATLKNTGKVSDTVKTADSEEKQHRTGKLDGVPRMPSIPRSSKKKKNPTKKRTKAHTNQK